MDIPRQKLRDSWAKQFPELSDEWTYWWIEGDGYCLAIIEGSNLAAAVEIIEDNWNRFDSIIAHQAKLIDDDLIRRDKNRFGISDRKKSKKWLQQLDKTYNETNSDET